MLTRDDITDKTYNPAFDLTDEVKGIIRNVFHILDYKQEGRVSRESVLALIRTHGGTSKEEEESSLKLAQELLGDQEYFTFDEFCLTALKWKELAPQSMEQIWLVWSEHGKYTSFSCTRFTSHRTPGLAMEQIVESAEAFGNFSGGQTPIWSDPRPQEKSSLQQQLNSLANLEEKEVSTFDKIVVAAKSLTAGGLAGMLSKTIVAPCDRVKILFQVTSRKFSLRAAVQLAVHVVRTEGPQALWRGNSAAIIRVFPYAGIQFMCFDQYKDMLLRMHSTSNSGGSGGPPQLSIPERVLAGAMAGATSVVFTYPLDLMRARLAVQEGADKSRYTSLRGAFRTMYRQGGAVSFYRGIGPTIVGILPYAGFAFGTNEALKGYYTKYFMQQASSSTGGGQKQKMPTLAKLACGGLAGLFAQSLTYPLDVVRRRMQTEGYTSESKGGTRKVMPGVAQTARMILATEGASGMFKGLAMNWLKAPISIGISFTAFDTFKDLLSVPERDN